MIDDEHLIGKQTVDVPKRDPTDKHCMAKKSKRDHDGTSLFRGYCRNAPGKGTDHLGSGRCKFHDGPGAKSGPENPQWKHGLNSTVLRDEDEAMLEAIEELSTRAKLEETLNLQMVKLYRAVESMEESSQNEFWDAFMQIVNQIEYPEDTDLRALAMMLGQNDRAIREWMDLIRKTAKDLHKITDGETVNHQHEVDEEQLDEIRELMDDAY